MTMLASTRTRVGVLLTSVVVALALLVGNAIGARADEHAADVAAEPLSPTFYTVRSGDTLWAIASSRVAPGDDVRVLIEDIRRDNGLTSSVIVPGQVLLIPAGG